MSDIVDRDSGLFRSQNFDKMPLTNLLSTVKSFQAYDPHDYIYGVLGMYQHVAPSHELPGTLLPNYNQPLARLYAEATRLCILESQSLAVLKDVLRRTGRLARIEGLPSWAPSWQQPYDLNEDEMYLASYFDASGGRTLQSQHPPSVSWNILKVTGLRLDSVEKMSEQYYISDFRSFMLQAQDMARACKDPTACNEALSRTLLADCNYDYSKATTSDVHDMQDALTSLRKATTNDHLDFLPHNPTPDAQAPSIIRSSARIARACYRACRGRRSFVSRDGRLGLGPASMRVGDSVIALYGARVPYVLRRDDASGQYELVGACYLDGVMYGEAIHRHQERPVPDRIFEIC